MVLDEILEWDAVTIKEHDVLTLGSGDCFVQDDRFPEPFILVPNMLRLNIVLFAKCLDARRCLIGGPIIREYQFKIVILLSCNTIKHQPQKVRSIVRTDDEGNRGILHAVESFACTLP